MQTIIILIGLPGSGKSTWAIDKITNDPENWIRVSRNSLRMMYNDKLYEVNNRNKENIVTMMHDAVVKSALDQGKNIIIDNTNLLAKDRNKYHNLAENKGNVMVIEKVFEVSLKKVLQNNENRDLVKRVPQDVIMNMARKFHVDDVGRFANISNKSTFYDAKVSSILKQDENLPKAIICDLDGTLSLLNGRNPFDAKNADKDLLNEPIASIVNTQHKDGKHIIFLTGCDEKFRPQTEKFLSKYMSHIDYKLYMRPKNDKRKDTIVKKEIFNENIKNNYNVSFVLEDRNKVVDMWRSIGLTCLQVDYGDF